MENEKLAQAIEVKTIKVTLGGKEVEIKKLKSGEYYKAQSKLLDMASKISSAMGQTPGTKVDIGKVQANIPLAFDKFPEDLFGFLALTTGQAPEFLKGETYPEEISEAVNAVVKLNNFGKNFKNSLLPMQALGK